MFSSLFLKITFDFSGKQRLIYGSRNLCGGKTILVSRGVAESNVVRLKNFKPD